MEKIDEFNAVCKRWGVDLGNAHMAIATRRLAILKTHVENSGGEICGQSVYRSQSLLNYACQSGFFPGVEYLLSLPGTDVNFFLNLNYYCGQSSQSVVADVLRSHPDAARLMLDMLLAHRDRVIVDSAWHSDNCVLRFAVKREMPPDVIMKVLRLGAKRLTPRCECGIHLYPDDRSPEDLCTSRITMLCIFSDRSLKRKLSVDLWKALLRMLSKY